MHRIQDIKLQVMYSSAWQAVRVGLLGKWGSEEGARENIEVLKQYIGDGQDLNRVWRVLNLLNAVRMGFNGQRLIGSKMDELVIEFRIGVQLQYGKLLAAGKKLQAVSDEETLREWRELDASTQALILSNLSKRRKLHEHSSHRDDLSHYLRLISSGEAAQ
jgi:hypothetical protein